MGNEITEIFFQFMKDDPMLIITNISFALLIPIHDIVLPDIYGRIMTAIENKDKKYIYKLFILVVFLICIIEIGYTIADWHDTKLFPQLQSFIRTYILKRIIDNNKTCFREIILGDIMSKIIKIPIYLTQWFERVKNVFFPYILTYIAGICYFLYHDIQLGICLGVLIISHIYMIMYSPVLCKKRTILKDEIQNELHEEIDDTLRNLISIYSGNQEEEEFERLDTYEKKYTKAYKYTMDCALYTRICVLPVLLAFIIFFFYRSNVLLANNKINSAKFISLFIIVLYILSSMMYITDQVRDILFETGIFNNINSLFDKKPQVFNNTILSDVIIPPGLFIYDLTYSYTSYTEPVLKNITLTIQPGERVAIIGEIGGGKSTLLKLILKLEETTSGQIILDGIPYSNIPIHVLREKIGYVPQQPILFNRTVLENIKYSNPHVTDDEVTDLFEKYNISDEFSNLEDGLNTKVGKNGSKISGGQRQLIWSLRILLHKPEILILDEPTASLDEKTKDILIQMYDIAMQNKTIIMVTHDKYLMNYAKRHIELKDGHIISDTYVN